MHALPWSLDFEKPRHVPLKILAGEGPRSSRLFPAHSAHECRILQLSCSDMQTTLTLTPEPSAPETAPELYLIMEEEKLNVCGFAGLGATLTGGRRAADWFPALSEHGRPRKWGS